MQQILFYDSHNNPVQINDEVIVGNDFHHYKVLDANKKEIQLERDNKKYVVPVKIEQNGKSYKIIPTKQITLVSSIKNNLKSKDDENQSNTLNTTENTYVDENNNKIHKNDYVIYDRKNYTVRTVNKNSQLMLIDQENDVVLVDGEEENSTIKYPVKLQYIKTSDNKLENYIGHAQRHLNNVGADTGVVDSEGNHIDIGDTVYIKRDGVTYVGYVNSSQDKKLSIVMFNKSGESTKGILEQKAIINSGPKRIWFKSPIGSDNSKEQFFSKQGQNPEQQIQKIAKDSTGEDFGKELPFIDEDGNNVHIGDIVKELSGLKRTGFITNYIGKNGEQYKIAVKFYPNTINEDDNDENSPKSVIVYSDDIEGKYQFFKNDINSQEQPKSNKQQYKPNNQNNNKEKYTRDGLPGKALLKVSTEYYVIKEQDRFYIIQGHAINDEELIIDKNKELNTKQAMKLINAYGNDYGKEFLENS